MQDIVADIRKKDKHAVALLYNRFGKKLFGYAVHKWRLDEDEAWELTYKTLYRIIEVIDRYTFESESKFSGFVFQVFINYLRNHYNAQKNKQAETPIAIGKAEFPDLSQKESNNTSQGIHMTCLQKILEQFDDWKRVLLLMKTQSFSYEEISTYVGRPAEQLKVYYMRARQSLVQKVNECVKSATHA